MGCCSSHPLGLSISHKQMLSEVDEDFKGFLHSSNGSPSTINDPMAIIENITLNPLAYSLLFGRFHTFRMLKESLGASLLSMESLLEKQNLSGVEIILNKGYLDILKYYLPEYLLQFNNDFVNFNALNKPLIHLAVSKGYVDIVKYLFKYFEFVCPPPAFDIHYIDPKTGENSALVAAKNCFFPMVKLLNEVCKADFSVKNNNALSALQLAVIGSKRKLNCQEVLKYLIEKCQVCVDYEYEFVLENLSDAETIEILQKKLKEIRIECPGYVFQERYSNFLGVEKKSNDDSQINIAAMSSISIQDSNYMLSFTLFTEEKG